MIIEQLVSSLVPTLLPSDTGSQALHLMDASNLTQLPIVTDKKYVALLQENEVMDWETPESPLSASGFLTYRPAIFSGSHPLEALRIAYQQHLSVLPVVDQGEQYLGSITRDSLLNYLSENSSLELPGGIVVLNMEMRQYSLSEIARICENEDVTVHTLSVTKPDDAGMVDVTIKTNRVDLEALVSSFGRHSYQVKEVFGASFGEEDLKSRYDLLMNYLKM